MFKPLLLCLLLVSSFGFRLVPWLKDTCSNFDGQNGCQGQQTDNAASWSERAFQTPKRGDPLWRESYQDYNVLVAYAKLSYNRDLSQATVTIYSRVNQKYGDLSISVSYNGDRSKEISKGYSKGQGLINITVYASNDGGDVGKIDLEPVDFVWNHPEIKVGSQYKGGQKGAVVEMFGWPYNDIAEECEMLGKAGYLGVKVFPPQQAILDFEHPENGELNPWYWVYQPVSYRMHSRMGTWSELRAMIDKCRSNGVRVYADAVVNHMAGNGNDMFPEHCSGSTYWGNKNSSGGSPFWSQGYAYQNWNVTQARPGMEMPAVPYGPLDFHCARPLNSWTDGFILNYGWLVNLADLNTETEYVRQRIADYFTSLLSLGFSGFRIDAAKHISPNNLAEIFKRFKANMGGNLPADFITYLEVIIGGEKDLLMCQDNPYNFGASFATLLSNAGLTKDEITMIKIWESDYPKEFPLCGWPIPSERYVATLDCHDDQFPGSSSRDMGDSGSVLVKEKNVDKHRNFQLALFNRTDGNWQIKTVLSSYSFIDSRGAYGFPDGFSDCSLCRTSNCTSQCTKSMPKSQAHDPNVCGYTCVVNGSWKQGVYTRVHRDFKIIKAMRQWMGLSTNVSPSDVGLPSNCS